MQHFQHAFVLVSAQRRSLQQTSAFRWNKVVAVRLQMPASKNYERLSFRGKMGFRSLIVFWRWGYLVPGPKILGSGKIWTSFPRNGYFVKTCAFKILYKIEGRIVKFGVSQNFGSGTRGTLSPVWDPSSKLSSVLTENNKADSCWFFDTELGTNRSVCFFEKPSIFVVRSEEYFHFGTFDIICKIERRVIFTCCLFFKVDW